MRNTIWIFCLAGFLTLGGISCGDSSDDSGGTQQEATVPVPQLGLAANLMATVEQDPLRVLLSWDYTGTEDVSFAVYRAETAALLAVQNLTAARLLATTDDVFYEDENVVAGTTYYYRVRAVQGNTIGRASQVIAVSIAADGTGTVEVVEEEEPAPDDDGGTPPPEMPEPPTEPTPPTPIASHEFVLRFGTGEEDVDDDLSVYLNGQLIYDDSNGLASHAPDIVFESQNGDSLRIVAIDGGGCRYIARQVLTRVCDGATMVLGEAVAPLTCAFSAEVFYDETFLIDFPPAPAETCE